jgi:hypothetical protein
MTTTRQIAANRKNALRSTGPRTPEGKAVSSRNNTCHGLFASTPVIPRIESPAAWSQHRDQTIASLGPVGQVESALAERVALILWRLNRVARYEQDVTRSSRRRVHDDVTSYQIGTMSVVENQEKVREHLTRMRATLRALTHFVSNSPETRLAGRHAEMILVSIAHHVEGFDLETFHPPGIIPDDVPWHNVPNWTVERLHRFIAAIAGSAGREPDDLVTAAFATVREFINSDRALLRPFDRQLKDLRRERILPQSGSLDRVMRYEKHLTRQLAQTLAELRLLQRARATANDPATDPPPDPDALPFPAILNTSEMASHRVSDDSNPIHGFPPSSQPRKRNAR